MVSKKLRGMLVVAAAAMSMASMGAFAQAPGGGPPGGGPPRGPGGGGPGGGGFAQPTDAKGVMERFGLNSPDLKLSDAQKASIEKIANAYLEEQKKLPAMTPGAPPSPEAQAARTAVREKFTTEVGKVLTPDQNKTFQAAQAARRGGGPGGPPGGGPPGGA
jgi:Spy/CpxP family protein refolding chaperone